MKLKRYKKSKILLTQLKTIKLAYRKKAHFSSINSNKTLLNKILRIIYKYDKKKKKILFVGFPKQFISKMTHSKHIQISETILLKAWEPIARTQKMGVSKNISRLTLKLKEKADLIVIHNPRDKLSIVKKSYLNRIPIIIIGKHQTANGEKTLYESNTNYNFLIEKNEHSNIFFTLIAYALKKQKRIPQVKKVKNLLPPR